ncbi:hypothetical protein NHX12_026701 [Muraenolepis orangiensis]|uniref:Uncharacterized protein n=1 Tax=Muraenolepis orangiensis TaxID=630683 RepID=A0A9Q0EKI4_9TELE|nr:hypothetical protein NHX12_026701 [Muraenolepis orangiensis]
MRFCRREAHFHSDDDIRTLSREDFHEMLPGPGNLRQRKAVYELIHQQVHQQEPMQEANQGAVYHQYQLEPTQEANQGAVYHQYQLKGKWKRGRCYLDCLAMTLLPSRRLQSGDDDWPEQQR